MSRLRSKIDQPGGALRQPGMLREDTQRILKANLGKVVTEVKRGPNRVTLKTGKSMGGPLDPVKVRFGFGGPGSTDPIR